MSYSTSHLVSSIPATAASTSVQTSEVMVSDFESDVFNLEDTASDRSFNGQSYIVAQSFDQDVLGDIKSGFTNFVETGQVWALLIGLVLGYVIRGLTR